MWHLRQQHDLTTGRSGPKANVGFASLISCLAVFAESTAAQVFGFGEGWSSENPGVSASVHYREFTIYTGEDACEESGHPAALRTPPSPVRLRVGQRLYRSESRDFSPAFIVDAYDVDGEFLSRVPIVVDIIDPSGLMAGRSDWDYIEATKPGDVTLRFSWLCPTEDGEPISAERIVVVTEN